MNILCVAMGILDIFAGMLIYFYAPAWFFVSILLIVKGVISFI